jgi:hypothetical protein
VEENILAKIFHRNQYFRQHFHKNLPKTHVIKLFSQNGPFASHVSDKFCFFSKKLEKNFICVSYTKNFAKIFVNVYIFVHANFSQIFSRKSENEYFIKPFLKGSPGFWSLGEFRSRADKD